MARSRRAANHAFTQAGERLRYPGPKTLSVNIADRSRSDCSKSARERSFSPIDA
jgi:hypothetical protein